MISFHTSSFYLSNTILKNMTFVLDSAAFINESIFDKIINQRLINSSESKIQKKEDCYTVQEVLDELKDFKSKQLVEVAIASGKLRLSEVNPISLALIEQKAEEIGSEYNLSEADFKVLGLALQLNAKIITDDFTIQNLAAHIGLKFKGVMRGEIKDKKVFK